MDDDADMDVSYQSFADVRQNQPFDFAEECPQASSLQALAHAANKDDLWDAIDREQGSQNHNNIK